MVHFMAEKSHFCNLFAALLNITPKPELLKFHFFTDINKKDFKILHVHFIIP